MRGLVHRPSQALSDSWPVGLVFGFFSLWVGLVLTIRVQTQALLHSPTDGVAVFH